MGLFSLGFTVGIIFIIIATGNFPNNDVLNPDNKHYVIPEWVKGNAHWWSQGYISDEEFSYTMQYLLDQEIIKIENCKGDCQNGE